MGNQLDTSIMSSLKEYPEVTSPHRELRRIKNVEQERYLCVKTDPDTGKHSISTKTADGLNADSELDFFVYYYDTADAGETKMVLPVHEATKVCFSMRDDKKLQISGLHKADPMEEPLQFNVADERFFYIKSYGNNEYALEATNGFYKNHYLAVNKDNSVTIQEHRDGKPPKHMRFQLEENHSLTNFITNYE